MKTISKVIVLFTLFLILNSCKSQPVVFNDSLQPDKTSTIYYYGIKITEYNGIAVDWESPLLGPIVLNIPGGKTQFIFNGTYGSAGQGFTTYKNVPFVFDFENGKEYTISMVHHIIYVVNGKSRSRKDIIAIFNMTNGQTEIK